MKSQIVCLFKTDTITLEHKCSINQLINMKIINLHKQPSTTQQLNTCIGQLFSQSLKLSRPVESLHSIREKIQARGYQAFDKADILGELGQLQKLLSQLNSHMLQIDDLLKQHGHEPA